MANVCLNVWKTELMGVLAILSVGNENAGKRRSANVHV